MIDPGLPARRLLLVHAHPDDETITSGATMARYAASGVAVTLITCTRGEQGEVIPAELAHLGRGDEAAREALGRHRVGELAAAMAALGVPDHRFLGDYQDSGMAYDRDGAVVPVPDPPPGAFALADLERCAELLAGQLRAVRPQVLVGYDPGGGYGHPDHVRAHQVMMRAVELVEPLGWQVPKVYWVLTPAPPPGRGVPADQVTTAIDARAFTSAKVAALRAHETQVSVSADGASFALSNGVRQPVTGLELYRLVKGEPAGPFDALGRETDLFAGL